MSIRHSIQRTFGIKKVNRKNRKNNPITLTREEKRALSILGETTFLNDSH